MAFFLGYLIDTLKISGHLFSFSFASTEKPGLYKSSKAWVCEESAIIAAKLKILNRVCDRSRDPCAILHPISDRIIRLNEPAMRHLGNAEGHPIWAVGACFEELLEAKNKVLNGEPGEAAVTAIALRLPPDQKLRIIWLPKSLSNPLQVSVR